MYLAYAYTPEIWLPLGAACYLAALGLYSWRRRTVPAALSIVAASLFTAAFLLSGALRVAATAPASKIVWYRIQTVWLLPAASATTCFVLEYAQPGRWLTRRNLGLLAAVSLLYIPAALAYEGQLVWRELQVGSDGSVRAQLATTGALLMAYGIGLVLINAVSLLQLFIRSPQHRGPAALILVGQIANRGLYLLDATLLSATRVDLAVVAMIVPATAYAIVLFGMRIFEPLPAAGAMALQQMREGMVVLDDRWRVVHLNPAAARILSVAGSQARGMIWHDLLPPSVAFPVLSAPAASDAGAGPAPEQVVPTEIALGGAAETRRYTVDLSPLKDLRGQLVGRLLLLHDVTEQRQAQAQVLEQQRTLAMLQERERLARELHDGLGQLLAAAHLQVGAAKLLLEQGENAQVNECLNLLAETTLDAQADVREYLVVARTGFTADRPFVATLRQYLERFGARSGLPVELAVPPQLEAQRLAQPVQAQLLRIIQEALSNVRKHSGARRARVIFTPAEAQLRIAIVDDGCGFDAAAAVAPSEGYGLRTMRERAEAVGGSLTVLSSPGLGTQVVVLVPISESGGAAEVGS